MTSREWWVIPVCATQVRRFARSLFVSKTPRAVLVVGPGGTLAFDVDGSRLEPAALYAAVPGLRAMVERVGGAPPVAVAAASAAPR
jgi:hypothetical protein